MSSLRALEKSKLERLFDMSSGYVMNFSDSTMGTFFGDFDIDIHDQKYQSNGTSKAKKLREFWRIESDHIVGDTIREMINLLVTYDTDADVNLRTQCEEIAQRLLSGKVDLSPLRETITKFDLSYINRQLTRIKDSVESDPDLAIGTSKELIESCCKTILDNLNIEYNEKRTDLLKLVRLTTEQLGLLPSSVDSEQKGAEIIKKTLGNLGMIAQGITEIRNLYGTGHGKNGQASGLEPRHARLVATSASALVHFLFETYLERGNTL